MVPTALGFRAPDLLDVGKVVSVVSHSLRLRLFRARSLRAPPDLDSSFSHHLDTPLDTAARHQCGSTAEPRMAEGAVVQRGRGGAEARVVLRAGMARRLQLLEKTLQAKGIESSGAQAAEEATARTWERKARLKYGDAGRGKAVEVEEDCSRYCL